MLIMSLAVWWHKWEWVEAGGLFSSSAGSAGIAVPSWQLVQYSQTRWGHCWEVEPGWASSWSSEVDNDLFGFVQVHDQVFVFPSAAQPPLCRPGRCPWWGPSLLCRLQTSLSGWWQPWGHSHVSLGWTAGGSRHSPEGSLCWRWWHGRCSDRPGTDCGLSVWTSRSQLHRGVLKPRGLSLSTRCCGMWENVGELFSWWPG